jgi:hypothetical protein
LGPVDQVIMPALWIEKREPPEASMIDQAPLPLTSALSALIRCVATTAVLLARRRVHLPVTRVGLRLRFEDGTSSRVYRETVVDHAGVEDPCILVVAFRLRAVRGWGHRVFRWESLLNTPLFVGFPGFVSKLWLAHDERGSYRGLYEWDGPGRAEAYARALWWVLALVSESGSIHYRVVRGQRRDAALADPHVFDAVAPIGVADWWRVVSAA